MRRLKKVVREQIGGGECATGGVSDNVDDGGSSCTRGDAPNQDSRDVAQDGIMTGACEDEDDSKAGKGNWLVALAGSLATVQNKFLKAAMDDMKIMEDNAASATQSQEGQSEQEAQDAKDTKRDQFIQAQSRYQANMQMFNMIAKYDCNIS